MGWCSSRPGRLPLDAPRVQIVELRRSRWQYQEHLFLLIILFSALIIVIAVAPLRLLDFSRLLDQTLRTRFGAMKGPAARVEANDPTGRTSSILSLGCSCIAGADTKGSDKVEADEGFVSASMAYVKASAIKSGLERTAVSRLSGEHNNCEVRIKDVSATRIL
jgi:hypothetical protein